MIIQEILLPTILVAILGILGNIIYFEHKFKKEHNKEILKRKLTDLLLPLYFAFSKEEFELNYYINNDDNIHPAEFLSEQPSRLLNNLQEIIKKNIYLADDDLHEACLNFLDWTYKTLDSNKRFELIMNNEAINDDAFIKLKKMVFKKYNEDRNRYIK